MTACQRLFWSFADIIFGEKDFTLTTLFYSIFVF